MIIYSHTFNVDSMIKNKSGRLSPGMTVIEVLVVIAIISIIAVMGIPLLQSMVHSNRVATQANEFIGHLNYARSEAVRRGERVVVCKSSDGETCAETGGWDQGWIVFVDSNDSNDRDSDEELLQVRDGLEGGSTMTGNGNVEEYVSFLSNGGLAGLGTGTVTLCSHSKGVEIIFIRTGRVRTERVSCS